MADSKQGLNLVGVTITNIKNDLLELVNIINNQLTPAATKAGQALGGFLGGGGGGGSGGGPNKVSDRGDEPEKNKGGLNTLGKIGFGAQVAMGAGNLISRALPSASIAVQQDLLTAQSAFYGQGGFGGNLLSQSANVRNLQNQLARMGIATNAMDTTRALAAAQGMGLSGATNFNQVMQGAAVSSNFAPGIGVSGAMQAMGTINAPQTVNMLRTVGINVRGPNGNVLPLPQVVEQIWSLITQNNQIKLSEQDVQFGLMPGNGLYGMLSSLFGGDQLTYTLVSNMLLAKARTGGTISLSTTDRSDLQKLGLTTATVNKMARQTAAQTALLTGTASAISGGVGAGADLGNAMNSLTVAVNNLTGVISAAGGLGSFYSSTMGLNNGMVGSAIKTGANLALGQSLASAAGKIGGTGLLARALPMLARILPFLFLEKGGPADAGTPYVVGEKGPELFVPKTDGTVIPNSIFREDGGGVTAGGSYGAAGSKTALTDKQLRNVLTAAGFKGSSLDTALAVARAESGGRPGALNPTAATGDYSMGLFQINMIGDLGKQRNAEYLKKYKDIGYKGPQSLYDPAINAAIAFDISKGGTVWSNAWKNTSKKLGITDGGTAPSSTSGSTSTAATSSLSPYAPSAEYSAKIQSLLAAASVASGSGVSNTYNNGPININISGVNDAKKIADQVQQELSNRNILVQTGTR